MAIRVAHVGTGNVGGLALAELITNPQFELTAVCVSTPEKVGKDAGELCGVGLEPGVVTGVTAVSDLDALLATQPECVVYCAMGDTRLPDAMADVMRVLAAGVNVVGSSPGLLQYPWGVMPEKYIGRVEDAARQGNSSIFISGVDPGFANDLIPFALAGTCQRVEQVRCMEIHDYASYAGAEVMHYMGFGRPMDEIPMLLQPGILSIAWGTAIRQLAAGLGIEVDEITESYQREPAPEDFDIAVGRVAKGTVAVLQFEIRGMVDG
ncbi:diacylglycerol kinase, partial [Mycobacterium sp. UM_3]